MKQNILFGDELEINFPLTLGELIEFLLQQYEDKVLQIDGYTGEQQKASTILQKSTRLARWLQQKGLKPGDTISIISENRLEYCLVPCAAFLTGISIAPLNPEYTPNELQHTLNLSKPKIIFCSPKTLPKIETMIHHYPFVENIVLFGRDPHIQKGLIISLERALEQRFLDALSYEQFEHPKIDTSENVATILCSSGTTGIPKGVMTTQKNMITLISVLRQVSNITIGDDVVHYTTVGVVPFFHSMGFMSMMLSLMGGHTIVILNKFNIKTFLEVIQNYKVTVLAIPPPVIITMCQSPLVKQYDLSSIDEIKCGAAPLPKDIERRILKKFKLKQVNQAYGMTETTLGVCFMPQNQYKFGSVGKLAPGMLAKVIDEKGNSLGANREGELCFKGPLIMKGYVNDPVATANTIDAEGWLHTGDVGYYDDDQYFFVVDRIKELIKYKGYQVPPAELESVLMSHPDILDAAVVGIPDDLAGELPLGYVVKKPKSRLTPQDIQNFVKEKVSPQKQLRGGVKFIDVIPRNPSGKILRRILKQMAINHKSKL